MGDVDEHLAAANAGHLVGGPGRYRKRPIVVDAFQTNGQADRALAITAWSNGAAVEHLPDGGETLTNEIWMRVTTQNGPVLAKPGEWIARDAEGFYPISETIFAATYEPA